MEPPDTRRNIYYPMDALNQDLLSQLGNVRFLMVPKDTSCDDLNSNKNILADDSDWMMAEKNKPRSPPISPAVPWSRTTFEFKSPDSDSTTPVKRPQELRSMPQSNTERTPTSFKLDSRIPDFSYAEHDGNLDRTPQRYAQSSYRDDERLLKTKRQLFRQSEQTDDLRNNQASDKISQLLSFIEATSSKSSINPSVLRSVQPSGYHQPNECHCCHPTSPHLNHYSKRRKLDTGTFASSSKKENIHRKSDSCTCSMMEEHFLQMAETAYKNIRRKDTTPASFEQFKRELTHTNDILKESVDIVNQIKELCEHRKLGNV